MSKHKGLYLQPLSPENRPAEQYQRRRITVAYSQPSAAGHTFMDTQIEDMLVHHSSWREQQVPHKRPNKSVC